MNCPGDCVRGKEGEKAFRPRRLCPQEVGYTGLNMLGDTACWKEKRRSQHARGHSPREREFLHMPGDTARGKEKGRSLDFSSDFARGKERIVVSTCPGN